MFYFISKKILFIGLLLLTLPIHLFSENRILRGNVKCQGKGVSGIVVSNGITCTKTNSVGAYILPSDGANFVFISTPSGYITKEENSIPLFYHKISSDVAIYDFEIWKNPKDDKHHLFIAQADVQVTDSECLETYTKMLPDCMDLIKEEGKNKDVFGVDCGDIVGDMPSLYPDYIKATSSLCIPIYRAIGNHDMDYYGRTFETSHHTFEDYFGPTCYSFNKGKAHYIVLNDTFYFGREYFYMGYIDEKTFHWLEQDLSYIDTSSPVFIIMHIPSQLQEKKIPFEYNYSAIADQMVNASAFHDFLKSYHVHIISGHMHYNRNMIFSPNLMEHNTGAVCGTWWRTDICLDGTPRGYGVYEIDGTNVKWYFKSAGYPKDYQMRTYPIGASKEYPSDIIVNVWNWDENWKVEWFENGINRGEMIHFTGYDPLAEERCRNKEQMKYDWISVTPTDHLFRATPQMKNSKIEIKVTDCFGRVYLRKI